MGIPVCRKEALARIVRECGFDTATASTKNPNGQVQPTIFIGLCEFVAHRIVSDRADETKLNFQIDPYLSS
jgi:hypothetical protein